MHRTNKRGTFVAQGVNAMATVMVLMTPPRPLRPVLGLSIADRLCFRCAEASSIGAGMA